MPIPYALDPSLHAGPPAPRTLEDGFCPPEPDDPPPISRDLATHPVEPETPEPGEPEPAQPNTSRLPIEPEFAPEWRPAEPEDPGTKPSPGL